MSGSSMMANASFGPCSLIVGCARWTLPLASFGATRGRIALGNTKSSARLLCPPERFHEFSGWDTAYVRDTVVAFSPDAGATALGSAFGTREQINARAWESVRACDELRSAINGVDHAPTELVLTAAMR